MRIQIISDLHHEFGISLLDFNDIDALIISGDLDVGVRGVEWLKENVKHIPVIYVLGNHEYYKGSYPKTLYKIEESAANSNIHVLENKSLTIDGISFHGTTLWTDFALYGNSALYGSMCQQRMNDYKRIRLSPSYSKLRSVDTYHIHKNSLRWLEDSLENSCSATNIVVTHHAPSIKSIPEEFKNDYLSSAYASDLESLILKFNPDCWVHGHIHQPTEYVVGRTKVLCNPHGYITEKYNGYNPKLVIDI